MTSPGLPPGFRRWFTIGALGVAFAAPTAHGANQPSDTPSDYAYNMPLTISGTQGVVQLRLPKALYLHARSAELNDVRVFDASGEPLPFAFQQASTRPHVSHRSLPVRLFPLHGTRGGSGEPLDLDVSTSDDGRLLSVKIRQGGAARIDDVDPLVGLVLDLRPGNAGPDDPGPLVDSLRFTLPAGMTSYTAEVWMESSDDLKQWEALGGAELNWLVNSATETLESDRLDFEARRFRYARLSWIRGAPLQFASISANSPSQTVVRPEGEQLLIDAGPGKEPQDLVFQAPIAIGAQQVGLQFDAGNVVMPAQLGTYRELPAHQIGQPSTWQFQPLLRTTFYQITQAGRTRSSGNVDVDAVHTDQWVLRATVVTDSKPRLKLVWTPATMYFLAKGKGPITLAFGRDGAESAQRDIGLVAPGFSATELLTVEQAGIGPLIQRPAVPAVEDDRVLKATRAANLRALLLWGVLLIGVIALVAMVWTLLRQMRVPPQTPDA